MNISSILFYAIGAFILVTGLLSVTSRFSFRSAIWLLSSLTGIAALYFWMQVEFIAAVQIIVYVGGIVVLILFSVFLTQQSATKMPSPSWKRIVASVMAVLCGLAFTVDLITRHGFKNSTITLFNVRVDEIGMQMLSTTSHGYILPFEVVSMLLLSAMIGCIVIAMKSPAEKTEDKTIEMEKDTTTPVIKTNAPAIQKPLITEEV